MGQPSPEERDPAEEQRHIEAVALLSAAVLCFTTFTMLLMMPSWLPGTERNMHSHYTVTPQVEECLQMCWCNDARSFVNCSNQRLNRVPDGIPPEAKELFLDNSDLHLVLKRSVSNLPHLSRVFMRSSHIATLQSQSFMNLPALEELHLSNNSIATLSPDAFEKVDALTHINLQANKLTSVVDLHSLPGLEILVLSSNQIQNATFPAGYTMLTNLAAVDLSFNNISQLTNDTFAMLSKSRVLELDLSGNIIRNVSAGALKPLGSLKSLKLDGRQVQHMVEALKENSNLTSVALHSVDTGSTLPSLSSDLSHISLTTLILQNNQLGYIPDRAFAHLVMLRRLDLSTCQLAWAAETAFMDLPRLEDLDLSHNHLSSVPENLPINLQRLYLQGNSIAKLEGWVFKTLGQLHELHLGNNHIHEISEDSFMGLANLHTLDLQSNMLSSLPEKVFTPLTELVVLNLKNNRLSLLEIPYHSTMGLGNHAIHDLVTMLGVFPKPYHGSKPWDMWVNIDKRASYNYFASLENLQSLNLADNDLGDLLAFDWDGRLLGGMMKLQYLSISNNNIWYIQEAQFKNMMALKYLDLSNNRLSTWEPELFCSADRDRRSLTVCNLSYNQISFINKASAQHLQCVQTLKFVSNPIRFTRNLMWFLIWVDETGVPLDIRYSHKYDSAEDLYSKPTVVNDKHESMASSGSFFIVVLFTASLLWFLLFHYCLLRHSKRNRLMRHTRTTLDPGLHLYDFYVINAHEDVDWVVHNLLPALENTHDILDQSLRLFIEARDAAAGSLLTDIVFDNLEKSRGVLIVLTPNLCKDTWARFRTDVVFQKCSRNRLCDIYIIKVKSDAICQVPAAVCHLYRMENCSYIEWPSNAIMEKEFIKNLKRMLLDCHHTHTQTEGDGGTSLPADREAAESPMYKCISQGALLPVLKNMDGDTKKGAASPLTVTADSTFDIAADNRYTSHEDEVDNTYSYCDRGFTDAAFVDDSQEHADLGIQSCHLSSTSDMQQRKYDFYVIAAEEDTDWVMKNLLPAVECGPITKDQTARHQDRLRLFFPARDDSPLETWIASFNKNIVDSRGVLIVLTPNLFRFEGNCLRVNIACNFHIEDNLFSIQIIQVGSEISYHIPQLLRHYMDKYGYKAWPRTVVEDDDRMQQSHGQDHTQTEVNSSKLVACQSLKLDQEPSEPATTDKTKPEGLTTGHPNDTEQFPTEIPPSATENKETTKKPADNQISQATGLTPQNGRDGDTKTEAAPSQAVNANSNLNFATDDTYDSDEESDNSFCSRCTLESADSSTDASSTDEELTHTCQEAVPHLAAKDCSMKQDNMTPDHPEKHSAPMFSRKWQYHSSFNSDGGTLRKPSSDVILDVPTQAVKQDDNVVISTAVCADPVAVHCCLKLEEDEEIVTPLAEYGADGDYQFQGPVTIKLPHWLPPDFDAECLRVYHIDRDQDGMLTTTVIDRTSEEGSDNEDTPSSDPHLSEYQLQQELRRQGQAQQIPTVLEDQTTTSRDTDTSMKSCMWFRIEKDCILISTDHFCGFLCTYCGKKTKTKSKQTPQLYMIGSMSLVSHRRINISAHVWDERIKVADCRQLHDIEDGSVQRLNLLADCCKTKVTLKLKMNGLTHRLDNTGQPLLPEEKCFSEGTIGCQKCLKKGKLLPMSCQWALKYTDDCLTPEVSIEVAHVVIECGRSESTSLLLTVSSPDSLTRQNVHHHLQPRPPGFGQGDCRADSSHTFPKQLCEPGALHNNSQVTAHADMGETVQHVSTNQVMALDIGDTASISSSMRYMDAQTFYERMGARDMNHELESAGTHAAAEVQRLQIQIKRERIEFCDRLQAAVEERQQAVRQAERAEREQREIAERAERAEREQREKAEREKVDLLLTIRSLQSRVMDQDQGSQPPVNATLNAPAATVMHSLLDHDIFNPSVESSTNSDLPSPSENGEQLLTDHCIINPSLASTTDSTSTLPRQNAFPNDRGHWLIGHLANSSVASNACCDSTVHCENGLPELGDLSLYNHFVMNPSVPSTTDFHSPFPRENGFSENGGHSLPDHCIVNPSVASTANAQSISPRENGFSENGGHSLPDHCIVNPSVASTANAQSISPRENGFSENGGHSLSDHCIVNPSVASTANAQSISPRENGFSENGGHSLSDHCIVNPSVASTANAQSISPRENGFSENGGHSLFDHCIVNPSVASTANAQSISPRENGFSENGGHSLSDHCIVNPSVASTANAQSISPRENGFSENGGQTLTI